MADQHKPSITERVLSIFGYTKREYTLDELFDKAGPYNYGSSATKYASQRQQLKAYLDELFDKAGPYNYGSSATKYASQRQQLKAYVDWVYAAASAIAQDAATIDLRAYANRSGKPNSKIANQLVFYPHITQKLLSTNVAGKRALEELPNHILLDLLDNPNDVQDADTFKEMAFLHLLLAGEAFWYKEPGTLKRPKALWPIMPYLMKEKLDGREIVGWTYRVGAQRVEFDDDEIVHIKLTDPDNLYRGTGVVKAAARAINTGNSATDWNEAFFRNSARPDIALETDSKLSEDVVDRLRDQWSDNYGGANNAHKVAVLEQGLKLNKITSTQKEMDFLESMKFNRDQQLAMFKTSRTMLGIVEGDGRANMEAAEYNQAKRVIRPLMRRLVSAINHGLAPVYDQRLVIGFTDPVPEDKEFIHKTRVESVNVYRTINEVREEEGLEPIAGGDVIYQSSLLQPLGAVSTAPEPPEPPEPDEVDEGKKGHPKPRSLYQDDDERDELGELRAANQNQRADNYRPQWLQVSRQFFNQQKQDVLTALADGKGVKRAVDPFFDVESESKRLALLFIPLLTDQIADAGVEAMLLVAAHGAFDITDTTISDFIHSRTRLVSLAINQETDKQLRAELSEGISLGESIDELVARIERVYGAAAGTRAERIARTETIRAENFASQEAWRQSGEVESKEWYTARDERVCEFCGPMDGRVIVLNDNFFDKGDTYSGKKGGTLKIDFDDVSGPPLHVQCRCTLLPVLID